MTSTPLMLPVGINEHIMRNVMSQSYEPSHVTQPKVIAAIPCFNTEHFIRDVVSRAKKYVNQVIVIDDGSHDGTTESAKTAGALVINHSSNRGYGESIKSCFEAAKTNGADILVILDGDGQHIPEELPHVLDPILNKEADLVIGSRFLGENHSMPRYRRFGINVITWLYNLGSKVKVSDAQSGLRAYSRKLVDTISLRERNMSISIEILVKAKEKGFIIKEVPISCIYYQSSLGIGAIKHGLSVALNVIKLRLESMWRGLVQNRGREA
ncbi:glycosyltransferase family 2 protein [Chloroflexota bacterium]